MNNNKKTNNKYQRNKRQNGNGKNRKRGKEFEVNVPDSSVNTDDLKGLIFPRKDSGGNDRDWYNRIPALIEAVGRTNFNLAEGAGYYPIDKAVAQTKYTSDDEVPASAYAQEYFPGIMRLDIVPTYGRSADHTSGLNMATAETFTVMRNSISGSMKFDQNDVGLQIVAMDNAYMLYEYLVRMYQANFCIDYQNQYLPEMLLQAMRVNPSVRSDLANIEAAIDYFVTQLGRVNIPDQFDIIHRHSWLFSNVYTDADNAKAQMYLFVPRGLYVYTEATNDGGLAFCQYAGIETIFGKGKNAEYIIDSADDIVYAIDLIMKPILGSQDFGDINGTMMRAFGGKMINVSYLDKNKSLNIAYNQEVLSEIENAVVVCPGDTGTLRGAYVKQESSDLAAGPYLVSYPSVQPSTTLGKNARDIYSTRRACLKTFINMHTLQVDPLDVAVATRFAVSLWPGSTEQAVGIYNLNCGSEIVWDATIFKFQPNTFGTGLQVNKTVVQNAVLLATDSPSAGYPIAPDQYAMLTEMECFDWHPAVALFTATLNSDGDYSDLSYKGMSGGR